jgi:hypothetical protein
LRKSGIVQQLLPGLLGGLNDRLGEIADGYGYDEWLDTVDERVSQ